MGKNWSTRCVILEIGEDGVFYLTKCWLIIEKKFINMPNVSTNVKCIGSDEIVTRSQIKTWDIIVRKRKNIITHSIESQVMDATFSYSDLELAKNTQAHFQELSLGNFCKFNVTIRYKIFVSNFLASNHFPLQDIA